MTVQDKIRAAAARYGVPEQLALNVAHAESGYRQFGPDGSVLRSSEGALGVMQLMPATAAWLGVDPANEDQNIEGGVRYLSMLHRQFSWDLVPAAYNTGPGNLAKILQGLKTLPSETAAYVRTVVGRTFEEIVGSDPRKGQAHSKSASDLARKVKTRG